MNYVIWTFLEGQIIKEQYHLKKFIGAGCFGAVFTAEEIIRDRLIRKLAIKLVVVQEGNCKLENLINSTRLKHPHLLECYGCGECIINGVSFLYLLMELGEFSLKDFLKNNKLSELQIVQLIKNIAEALEFIQSNLTGFCRCDLKPANLIWANNTWKLADMTQMNILENNSVISLYAPPEFYDFINIPKGQIWSLGVIISQALTGELPFSGTTNYQVLKQIITATSDLSKLPFVWQKLVSKCLQENPNQRPSLKEIVLEIATGEFSERHKAVNKLKAKQYFQAGKNFLNQGDFQNAVESFTQAVSLEPDDFYSYTHLGIALVNTKNFLGAIENFSQAIMLEPDNYEPYNNRGVVKSFLNDYDGAIHDYSLSIKLNPNYVPAYNNRAIAFLALQNYSKALEDFSQVIRLDPNQAENYRSRGSVYSELKNYAKAIEDFSQAIKLNPDYIAAYYHRGIAYERSGDYSKALLDFEQVRKLESR